MTVVVALLLAGAQAATAVPGAPSLVQNPQGGATPRPLPATPASPPAATTRAPLPATAPIPPAPLALPLATDDPLHLDLASDPVLQLARTSAPVAVFRRAIAAAVARDPALDEVEAQRDEAQGARDEARARRLPVADLGLTGYRVFGRAFSNDPDNALERLRPRSRTDATVRVQQPLFDFGAGAARVGAGNARLAAAAASVDDVATQLGLRAIAAWYSVYGLRALVRLGESFATSQRVLRGQVEQRVTQGIAAPGDVAQVDGYLAASDTELAGFRRQLAAAEAQYTATVGAPAPPTLGRAPEPDLTAIGPAVLDAAAAALPAVRAARLSAQAARQDARAAGAERLPQLTAGVDFGRYGVFETARDYDLRGNLALTVRLGGGVAQRAAQARARASGADARLRRVREEADRDARIALSDVEALTAARDSIEANYIASRRSRDVLAERFRVARGTLFDLIVAQNNFLAVAARYIQTVTELDTARYALLARTGRLLPALGIGTADR